jgi:hypothetical protein
MQTLLSSLVIAAPPFSIHLVAAGLVAAPEGEVGSVEAFERKVREAALTWSTSSINWALGCDTAECYENRRCKSISIVRSG